MVTFDYLIDIVKISTSGQVAIYNAATGDFVTSYSPDNVKITTQTTTDTVKVTFDNNDAVYFNIDLVDNTQVQPAAAVPFVGNVYDLAELLATDFFFEVGGGGVVPTKTSDLINDGDDGNPFISLNDLPSNLILYATTAASDIPTYFKLVSSITDPSFDAVAVNVSTGAITTTNQFISALATPANVIVGNPGVLNISTIGNIRRTAGTGNAEFYFEVWKRDLAGTETLITTSGNTPPVFNGVYAEFSASALWNDGIFLATDRIVLKFYGSRVAGGSTPTYDFQFGGSIPVRSLVPLPLTVIPVLKLDELQDVTIATALNNDALIYESSTQLWKNKTIGGWNYIVKSANQDVTNSATLQDDTELQFSVVAGGQYMIELDVVISMNNSTSRYSNRLDISAGTMKGMGIMTNINNAGAAGVTTLSANAAANTAATSIINPFNDIDGLTSLKIIFSFTASANAIFKYKFANLVATVGGISRTWKGSILKYKKIN
jgi:hypothetical protein